MLSACLRNVNLLVNKYPKVLLLCSFNQSSANGITIGNLFKTWPAGKVAVAEFSDTIESSYVPQIRDYYTLGSKEARFIWPFRYLMRIRESASYHLVQAPSPRPPVKVATGLKAKLRSILSTLQVRFLQSTGLAMVSREFRISPEFEKWVKDFAPDVIYASTGDINKLEFFAEMKRHFNTKCAIHMFDDYVNSRYESTWFPAYWQRRLDQSFRKALDAADLHLSIGDKMSAEYEAKYGKPFYGFHNPIDPDLWMRDSAATVEVDDSSSHSPAAPFTFVYAGKINKDTVSPLVEFIGAIERLQASGNSLRLKIYSPYPFEEIYRLLGERARAVYEGKLPYDELPAAFRAADALLLPLDFTESTIRYIRLSILTKATEYMISGSPIFLYTPKEVAVAEYLSEHKAAYYCGHPDALERSILDFVNDAEMRSEISKNALKRAQQYHLLESVGERLRALIEQA